MNSFSEESIFDFARRISTDELRDEYLNQVCGENQQLRNRIDKLIVAHEQDSRLWDLGLSETGSTVDMPDDEAEGMVVGRYRIREKIGEGGMGVVYVADQTQPIQRRVALKLVKPGMDSRDVLARFEAERQALALMDHPNIASVFDAGTNDSGRPYFVMELVHGLPITEYCDLHRLSSRERLELFIDVCNAVQHAHQKGIIHRDLETVQCDDYRTRRSSNREGHRLWRRQSDQSATHRPNGLHTISTVRRHADVHESRTGGFEQCGCRHTQ